MRFSYWSSDVCSSDLLAATLADGGVVMIDTLAPDPSPLQPSLDFDRVEVRRDGRWLALDAADTGAPLQLAPDDREMRIRLRLLSYDDPQAVTTERSVGEEGVSTCQTRWRP